MKETQSENNLWQKNTESNFSKEDLGRFQAQYQRVVSENGMSLVHERNFQFFLYTLLSICALGIGYNSYYKPYSYICSFTIVAIQWFVFILYDRLRAQIQSEKSDQQTENYFRRKRDIIILAAKIRKAVLINIVFISIAIWSGRSPEHLFNSGGLSILILAIVMSVGSCIHYITRIQPVVNYLKSLVKSLEAKNDITTV